MNEKTTLGRLPREAIRSVYLPDIPREVVERYRSLVDLTGTISDAMEMLEAALEIDAGDTKRKRDIDAGASVADLMQRKYKA